ncbi:hypothetical protein [Leifsonia sp. NPDC058230]|uniref:hypothetical protein n=1 Tax=Leifsonia sp. NPDC058230 TaxID=3346391 RepID=UPI0036DB205D
MNHTYTYDRAHDEAHRLARRHERDLHWAKERRRQHERELGEALLLVSTKPITLARKTVLVTAALFLAIIAGEWLVQSSGILTDWMPIVQWVAVALIVAVFAGALVSLLKLKGRLAAARTLLRSNQNRLAHTQYHINESVHLFVDSRVEVHNTRQVHLV